MPMGSHASGKSLAMPLASLALLYVVSILFFHYIEGWSYIDAAYYTTATISTVGYGDITPLTDMGKLGTIILIFGGVSIAFYVITHIGMFRERTIDPHIQRRLQVLRSLTALQTGRVESGQIKRIKEKMTGGNSHGRS